METISGFIVVVLFFDEKSSYQIAKIKTASGDITVSGYFPLLSKELEYSFSGEYVNHPKYGRQFKVQVFSRSQENSKEGIINYLGLLEPIYSKTTNYGHFGKANLPWEIITK